MHGADSPGKSAQRRQQTSSKVSQSPDWEPIDRRRLGIVVSEYTNEDGAAIFQQARKLGLEGIVSKRMSAPYRSGPSRDWLKVKNPNSPAMIRAREAEW
jgi:ATP-dependent DNA ligase